MVCNGLSFCLSDEENFVSHQEISLNFEETRETFEKFPFSPQLWWLSPNWQFSIQLYSGKLWIFTKCHLNWHFLTFKRSLVENSGNSSLESFWCHLICLQNLNLKWEIFCDNICWIKLVTMGRMEFIYLAVLDGYFHRWSWSEYQYKKS